MKHLFIISLFLLGLLPVVFGVGVGGGVGIVVGADGFTPELFVDPNVRITIDDPAGTNGDITLRTNNYAFQGEQVSWQVLVWDRNGIEDIENVRMVLSNFSSFSLLNTSVTCLENATHMANPGDIGARDEAGNYLNFTNSTMSWYGCTLTVGSGTSGEFSGQRYIRAQADDLEENQGTSSPFETWFFNPELALTISDTTISFGELIPGMRSTSDTLTIENSAQTGSGVLLNMSLSGNDFFSSTPGARCPDSNRLLLSTFDYYASAGSFNTCANEGVGGDCHDRIPYENGLLVNNGRAAILDSPANVLSPGSEVTLNFRLDLPQPCMGTYDSGQISFWGEAI